MRGGTRYLYTVWSVVSVTKETPVFLYVKMNRKWGVKVLVSTKSSL